MANPHNLQVGQILYFEPINNASRHSKEIKTAVVSRIGSKYFYIKDVDHDYESLNKYYNDTLTEYSNYAPDWQGYLSLQDINDKKESFKLLQYFGDDVFRNGRNYKKLSLDQLRRIKAIVDEGESKDGL